MKLILRLAVILFLALFEAGCMTIDPEAQKAVAERSVNFTVWGIYCINQACGLGYLQYQRNPKENLEPQPMPVVR